MTRARSQLSAAPHSTAGRLCGAEARTAGSGRCSEGYGNVTRAGKLRWGLGRYPKCVVAPPTQCRCYWRMNQSVSSRLELLQAVLKKASKAWLASVS